MLINYEPSIDEWCWNVVVGASIYCGLFSKQDYLVLIWVWIWWGRQEELGPESAAADILLSLKPGTS